MEHIYRQTDSRGTTVVDIIDRKYREGGPKTASKRYLSLISAISDESGKTNADNLGIVFFPPPQNVLSRLFKNCNKLVMTTREGAKKQMSLQTL